VRTGILDATQHERHNLTLETIELVYLLALAPLFYVLGHGVGYNKAKEQHEKKEIRK